MKEFIEALIAQIDPEANGGVVKLHHLKAALEEVEDKLPDTNDLKAYIAEEVNRAVAALKKEQEAAA